MLGLSAGPLERKPTNMVHQGHEFFMTPPNEKYSSSRSRYADLIYTWDKVEMSGNNVVRVLPLPNQARLSDHNRVLNINNIQLYDAGTYRCHVRRLHGQSTSETVDLMLQGGLSKTGTTHFSWKCSNNEFPFHQLDLTSPLV